MIQSLNFLIGIVILILGFPLGNYLAKVTKEELRSGQRWFKIIIFLSFIGAAASIFLKNDTILFTFLFIIIVTSRSLRKK